MIDEKLKAKARTRTIHVQDDVYSNFRKTLLALFFHRQLQAHVQTSGRLSWPPIISIAMLNNPDDDGGEAITVKVESVACNISHPLNLWHIALQRPEPDARGMKTVSPRGR